ncbi:hypothetical protein [Mycoplasmopsis citelli]|uniref:hypothetical protein n=1 Tax=Mycoplasmopsis citelli TaxID=171281 RepID=UPI00101E0CC4|nr:hypothetical protein [Mycoplasmopsis citelli]
MIFIRFLVLFSPYTLSRYSLFRNIKLTLRRNKYEETWRCFKKLNKYFLKNQLSQIKSKLTEYKTQKFQTLINILETNFYLEKELNIINEILIYDDSLNTLEKIETILQRNDETCFLFNSFFRKLILNIKETSKKHQRNIKEQISSTELQIKLLLLKKCKYLFSNLIFKYINSFKLYLKTKTKYKLS